MMTGSTGRPRVLVVDEELAVLEIYREVFEMYACEVRTAVNGVAILACLAHEDIKLVILDLFLPAMKGLDVLMRIKEMDKPIVVIAIGRMGSTLERQAMQAGAYTYLAKPFIMASLINIVVRALGREFPRFKELDSQYKPGIIIRSIEFPLEYYQAGIGIFNYFYRIIQQKYPNIPVKINIEQEDLTVRMIIDTPGGHRAIIERTLADYGLVIAGKKAPESLLQNEVDVIALKHKLEITALELRHTRDLLRLSESGYQSLKAQVNDLLQLVGSSLQHFQRLNSHFLENPMKKISKYQIGTVIGWNSGDVSDTAHIDITPTVTYNSNDLVEIGRLVGEMLNHDAKIHIPPERLADFEASLQTVQAQLAVQTPNQSIIKEALRSARNIIEEAMGGLLGRLLGTLLLADGS